MVRILYEHRQAENVLVQCQLEFSLSRISYKWATWFASSCRAICTLRS
jgi:hypothetical protein